MNTLDIIFVIPLIFGLIQGARQGLVKEIGSLVAIMVGIYVSRFWSAPLGLFLTNYLGWSPTVCRTIAYILVFILGALSVQFLAYLLTKTLKIIRIAFFNRLLGAAFGFLKYLLFLSVILNVFAMFHHFKPIYDNVLVTESFLYKPIQKVMPTMVPFLGFDKFKEHFK